MADGMAKRNAKTAAAGFLPVGQARYSDQYQGRLKPWQPGDPVASGEVYLPDEKTRQAYGMECQRRVVESWAHRVMAGHHINIRRARIQQCPDSLREQVKARVQELWRKR